MSKKIFRTIGKVAGVVAGVALIGSGIGSVLGGTMILSAFGATVAAGTIATIAGAVSLGASLLGKPKAVAMNNAALDRLNASINPRAPHMMVFGRTAMATEIRDQEFTGNDKEYLHRFFVVASHKVNSVQQIWFDDKLAWTSTGGVQGEFAGYLTVAVRTEGTPGNAINISSRMGSSRRFTGLAYVHLRYKLTGNSKKTESPFAQQVPTRMTIVGEGIPCYDPRQDSTVPGGSGSHRANNQATWTYGVHARNPACQLATWLLGWRIQNPATSAWHLIVGEGIPADRIDWASFIEAANLCDEPVAKLAGGTEPRYRGDGIVTEADDPMQVLEAFKACMNADLDDQDGLLRITVFHNDLAMPDADLGDDDIEGAYTWIQTPSLAESFNVVRGGYIEPSDRSLYQQAEYSEARLPSPDGIDRIHPADFSLVQSKSQAERLAKQRLQRQQYGGTFRATFLATGWKVQKNSVVRLTCGSQGWTNKLFRVVETAVQFDGLVPMVLREEHPAIYAWDKEEGPAPQIAEPTYYAPGEAPIPQFLGTIEEGATVGAPPGTPVGDRPADQVISELDQLEIDSAAHTSGIAAAEAQIADLFETYGDTASAAASAAAALAHKNNAEIAANNAEQAEADAVAARNLAQAAVTAAEQAKDDAENAEADAIAAAGAAAGSASTAAGHASTATTKANEAAGSATAASGSATTATTKAGEASVSAGQAASSATTAEGHKNAAASSATVAANARDAAQGHASAASSSASTAGTHASDAASSASAANTAKTQAETARGQAQTFASNASNSATDAAGSASNAASSAVVSASARDASVASAISLFPERLHSDWLTYDYTGSPEAMPSLPDVVNGEWVGTNKNISAKGVLPWIEGRIYEVTVIAEGLAANATLRSGMRRLPADYSAILSTVNDGIETPLPVGQKVAWSYKFGCGVGASGVRNVAECAWLRPCVLLSHNTPTGVPVSLTGLYARDVTDSYGAGQSAAAAASSASTASTHAGAAGTSASAAQTAATTATTKAGEASTSASQAASSASDALGYRNTASSHASNAANSATNAGNSASAAAGSASTASTQASNAASSASSAQSAANTATTKAGEASTSASSAATSATNALGSANTASSHASVAATARNASVASAISLFPERLHSDWLTNEYVGPPETMASLPDVVNGEWTGTNKNISAKGVLPWVEGRIYEVTVIAEGLAADATLRSGMRRLPADYSTILSTVNDGIVTPLPVGQKVAWSYKFGCGVGASGVRNVAECAWLRPCVLLSHNTSASVPVRLSGLYARDVTDSYYSGVAASAAATSASTATTKATEAGVSASASQTAATQAQGYANNASSSASTATSQASVATAQAAAAATSASLVAQFNMGSINPNPNFADWPSAQTFPMHWSNWSGVDATNLTRGSGVYGTDIVQLQTPSPSANVGMRIPYDTSPAMRRITPGDYILELDAQAWTGGPGWEGTALAAYWYDANGNGLGSGILRAWSTLLPDGTAPFWNDSIINRWRRLVTAPPNTRSAILYLFHSYPALGATYSGSGQKTARYHRAAIRPATAEESLARSAIPALQATVSTQGSVLATLDSQYASLNSTVATQGVTITNHTSALATHAGNISTLFGRAGVRVDVNGRVIGWETNNNGQTGDFKVLADRFSIEKPGGGDGMTWTTDSNGRGTQRVTSGGVHVVEVGYLG